MCLKCIIRLSYKKEGFKSPSLVSRPSNPIFYKTSSISILNTDPGKDWNNRRTFIIYPTHIKQPSNGWSYLVYFSFMKYDGKNFFTKNKYTGVYDLNLSNECKTNNKCNPTSEIWIQQLFHHILYEGYALVFTSIAQEDSYYYLECESKYKKDMNNIYSLCWNGNNPDNLPNNIKLNYNQMGLIGLSVGAQMVSRCYNDFPFLTLTNNIPFPDIKVGVMISGGSMHCYQYCNADPKSDLRKPNGVLCKNQPKEYENCFDKITRGCCPKDKTEINYDNGILEWKNHPATILAQTKLDNFADPNASIYYYNKLKKMGVSSQIISGEGDNHNLFPSAIIPIIHFIKTFLQI